MLLMHTVGQHMIHIIHGQTYIILTISFVNSQLPFCCTDSQKIVYLYIYIYVAYIGIFSSTHLYENTVIQGGIYFSSEFTST